jgi:TatD DNase family protein
LLIDTHAHVSGTEFNKDRAEVLARAREAGLVGIVDVGIDLTSSRRALALAAAHADIHAAVGIHPHDADKVDEATLAAVRELARSSPKVVAIGETGLDFYRNRSTREAQEHSLRGHLDIARDLGLPAILHLRSSATAGEGATDAYESALRVLEDYRGAVTGVSHCFSGTPALARALCDLGFFVSFAGNVSYPKAVELHEAARAVPLDRVVVETDCPYLSPQPVRGRRNEPAHVKMTAAAVAALRGVDAALVERATTENARRLFPRLA